VGSFNEKTINIVPGSCLCDAYTGTVDMGVDYFVHVPSCSYHLQAREWVWCVQTTPALF